MVHLFFPPFLETVKRGNDHASVRKNRLSASPKSAGGDARGAFRLGITSLAPLPAYNRRGNESTDQKLRHLSSARRNCDTLSNDRARNRMDVFAWLPLLAADIGVNQNSGRSFAVTKNQGTHRDSEVGTRERRCDIEDRKRQFALGALHIERWGGEHDIRSVLRITKSSTWVKSA